jgi:flagellar export protein FliJ
MTSKQKRIGKVIVHREKELDRKVLDLGKARVEAEQRELAVKLERQRLERAAAEREAMAERPMSASEWREANEWLQSRAKSHEAATHDLARANQHVEATQGHVMVARRALKGVEIYESRLRAEVAKAEDKADQKLEDELGRGRSARKRGKP